MSSEARPRPNKVLAVAKTGKNLNNKIKTIITAVLRRFLRNKIKGKCARGLDALGRQTLPGTVHACVYIIIQYTKRDYRILSQQKKQDCFQGPLPTACFRRAAGELYFAEVFLRGQKNTRPVDTSC